jgi:hypothetical protein
VLLGIQLRRLGRFRLQDSYLLWCDFPVTSTNAKLCHSLRNRQKPPSRPTTPNTKRLPAITRARFSLFRFRSPLLTESRLLSLPEGNEMFHFPSFPPHTLCVQVWVTGHDSSRVSPFGNPRITARLTAPRGLSQPPTSFIGSWCQGIHRAPLLTYPQRCSRPLCSSQATGGPAPLIAACAEPSRRRPASFDGRRSTRGGAPASADLQADRPTEALVTEVRAEARSFRTQQRAWATPDVASFVPAVVHLRGGASCTRHERDMVAAYWSVFHP